MQKAKVQRIVFPKDRRIIVVSDVHGHLQNLQKLLEKVHFSTEDILVIDGDLIEKGEQSLKTLRFVMQLAKTYSVYEVLGNNDWLWDELEREDAQSNQQLLEYMRGRNSILNEMCAELGISLEDPDDFLEVKHQLKANFAPEWDYLRSLPDILESEHYLFVHAGLESEKLEQQEKARCVKNDWFFQREICFSRWCVVGHFPVNLYDDRLNDCSVRIDPRRKLISIDGGCVMQQSGQLNALIIPQDGAEKFAWEYVDSLPKALALDAGVASDAAEAHCLHWPHNQVQVLEKGQDCSYCQQPQLGYRMWIPNALLSEWEGTVYTNNCTDYWLKICPGDLVSVVAKTSRGALIKKNGLLGWYAGRLQDK